jgi:hypothetical protein
MGSANLETNTGKLEMSALSDSTRFNANDQNKARQQNEFLIAITL